MAGSGENVIHTAHLVCREYVVEVFRKRLVQHAAISLREEPGCLRFDLHQDNEMPTRFLLLEVYADRDALEAHRVSKHYLEFRADTANWVVGREWWFWSALDQ